MPIHLPNAPSQTTGALRGALASLIARPADGDHIRALSAAAPVGLSDPHPVYAASAQDILDGRVLAAAQLIGWRSIVSKDGEPLAAAEVDNANALSNVNQGPFVTGTADAVIEAEQRFAEDAHDYELRLLRIPAVYAIAIWLHAEDSDVLIPVAPAPASLRAHEAMEEAAFTEALRPAAEATLSDRTSSS